MQPITWYDQNGKVQQLPAALDEFVHGENAYSLAHMELQPTTWDVCTAYFDATLTKKNGIAKIENDHQYWCWVLPMKVDGGQAKLVGTTSVEQLHVPFPIERGMYIDCCVDWGTERLGPKEKAQRSRPTAPRRRYSTPAARWSIPLSKALPCL